MTCTSSCDCSGVCSCILDICTCDASCKTCNGEGENACTSCNDGYVLEVCSKCTGTRCALCGSSSDSTAGVCRVPCEADAYLRGDFDCLSGLSLEFANVWLGLDPALPYLTVKSGLICYRNRVPLAGEALALFMMATGMTDRSASSWVLTKAMCDRYLKVVWRDSYDSYDRLFGKALLPASDLIQSVVYVMVIWVLQFGETHLTTDRGWMIFRESLMNIDNWLAVSAYLSPPRYFDGTKTRQFPTELETMIAAGTPDYKIFNLWNDVATACFSASCSDAESTTCCASAKSCMSPCCEANQTKKSGSVVCAGL